METVPAATRQERRRVPVVERTPTEYNRGNDADDQRTLTVRDGLKANDMVR
jgi:hypothetical protein